VENLTGFRGTTMRVSAIYDGVEIFADPAYVAFPVFEEGAGLLDVAVPPLQTVALIGAALAAVLYVLRGRDRA
jgi:hypothetical protein